MFACKRDNFRYIEPKHSQVGHNNDDEATGLVAGPITNGKHSSKKKGNGTNSVVTILPDGSRQVERSFLDEDGQVVTETIIEQSVPV